MSTIKLEFVKSSNINSLGYDAESQTMAVQFKGGKTYHYEGVPQSEFDEVKNSGSVGSAFLDLIRYRYNGILQN